MYNQGIEQKNLLHPLLTTPSFSSIATMKNIKSFDCRLAAKYGMAFNTFLLALAFPIGAIITISNLGFTSDTILAFLLNYLETYLFAGIIGGALQGYLFGFTYNFLSTYLEPIQAEFE
jgi:hypothetical protein